MHIRNSFACGYKSLVSELSKRASSLKKLIYDLFSPGKFIFSSLFGKLSKGKTVSKLL